MFLRVLKIGLIIILSLITLLGLVVFRLFVIKIYDSQVQIRHMKDLEEMYESEYVPIDESKFIDFDRYDQQTRLNQIQMLASHNSYKKTGSYLGRFFVGVGDSFEESRALKYGYKNLTTQFESGIRSMEFDVRKRKDSFVLTHVPLVDNSSVAPDFSMALDEINLYSINNPTHIPMIFLIEIKQDWMILDHALQSIEIEELKQLNNLIKDKLGDRLYTPNDFMEEDLTVKETVETYGWPKVTDLLGKVIFVLHPNEFNHLYATIDSSHEELSMFIGSYMDDLEHDYASFVIHNEVDVSKIQELVQNGFIVRTRIDEYLTYDEYRDEQARLSGAQILSTDFSIGRKDLKLTDMIDLNGYTIIKRL